MVVLVAWSALVSGVALTQFDPTSLDELSQLEALQAIDPGADDLGGQPLPPFSGDHHPEVVIDAETSD